MKCLLVFLLLTIYGVDILAQRREVDSLHHLISAAKSDTDKIKLQVKMLYSLEEINLDSATLLAQEVIQESKKTGYHQGQVDALLEIATISSRKGDYQAASQSLKQAESINSAFPDSALFAQIFSGYGMMYGMQAKYDTANFYFEKSMGIYERTNDLKKLGTVYGNIALGYQMQSSFAKALLYQQKSLRLAEEQNNLSSQAYTLTNMANTYSNMGDTLRSENTMLRAIDIATTAGLKTVLVYALSNLAGQYSTRNQWDKGYEFAMRASVTATEMGDSAMHATSLARAALALAHKQSFSEAESLNKQAMRIADLTKQPFNISQVNSIMGSILIIQKKFHEAIPYFEKSVHVLDEGSLFDVATADSYKSLSECYEHTGDYKKAFQNFKLARRLQDSLNSTNNIRKATELTMNFEFEKQQTIDKVAQEKKNAQASFRQLTLLIILIVTLLLASVAGIAFHNKRKANLLLNHQKEEIEQTLTQLKATQEQLVQSEKMASLGELTAGIAHEIQNPLNFVNNFSELNTELIEEMKGELEAGNKDNAMAIANDIKDNEQKINLHGKRADSIVKGMLQHSRSSTQEKEATNINALADECLRLSYHGFRSKEKSINLQLKTDFDQRLGNIDIISQDIGRVFLNLFNNAFYSVAEKKKNNPENYDPVVAVSTKSIGDKVEIRIRDNGNGVPQAVLDKIFNPFFTTKPTGQGTGLGLSLSYDIITKGHQGELKVLTEESRFAEFIITLPAPHHTVPMNNIHLS